MKILSTILFTESLQGHCFVSFYCRCDDTYYFELFEFLTVEMHERLFNLKGISIA